MGYLVYILRCGDGTLGGASGAMLYVVFGELLPESFRLCRSPAPVMAAVLGVLTGMGVVLG